MNNPAISDFTWSDFEKEFYTQEEISTSNRRARKMVMRERRRMRKWRREIANILKKIS